MASTTSSNSRPDGRTSGGTLRPLSCELSPLQRADGSALWKAGSTQILAAVYGPIAPQRTSVEKHDGAVLSIIFTNYREHEALLTKILEGCVCVQQYKRCVIEVVLQAINNDGAMLSCALHAIVAALMDAGIAMNELPIATTIALAASDDSILLDPCQEEEDQQACLTLISSNSNPERLLGSMGGGQKLSLERMLACMEAAAKANPAVMAFLRLALEQKVTRQSKTLLSSSN